MRPSPHQPRRIISSSVTCNLSLSVLRTDELKSPNKPSRVYYGDILNCLSLMYCALITYYSAVAIGVSIFLMKNEGKAPYWLFYVLIIKESLNKVQGKLRREKKAKKRNQKQKHQDKLASHDSMLGTKLGFALWITKANTLLNVSLHFQIWGSSLLKSQEFCAAQILQHIITMISIAKVNLKTLLICLVSLSGFNHVGTIIPMRFQQFFAKGHLKKRYLNFSSRWNKHNSQSNSKFIFFFLN
jgi:hypothetical protein